MALARPPMFTCGFAALGPQLHQLASAVDEEASQLQTSQIFTGLSVQSAVMARSDTVTQAIPGTSALTLVTWSAEEYRQGFDMFFNSSTTPARIDNISNPTKRHWFYLGWYIRTAGSPANTKWSLYTQIVDVDPITGLSTTYNFEKTFVNTTAATGEELLWCEMFIRNGNGTITTWAAQNSGAPINVGQGRFWIAQLSSQR